MLLVLAVAATATVRAQVSPAPASSPAVRAAAKTEALWSRIVMVGASATAGFTMSEPFGGTNTARYRLSRYVDAALSAPHESVQNLGDAMFFVQPETQGRLQIDRALKAKPTLLVGIDFLFWFCYGEARTDEERLQRFDQGLKLLEKVQCPLIIGDIPDASAASLILSDEQIPSPQVLATSNRRLKDWAVARRQVTILSVSNFMRAAASNQPLTVHDYSLPQGQTRILLQGDSLHPSAQGCALLALAILDASLSSQPSSRADDVRWDPKQVFRLVSNPSPPSNTKSATQTATPPSADK